MNTVIQILRYTPGFVKEIGNLALAVEEMQDLYEDAKEQVTFFRLFLKQKAIKYAMISMLDTRFFFAL